jgi:hypothetical protein
MPSFSFNRRSRNEFYSHTRSDVRLVELVPM